MKIYNLSKQRMGIIEREIAAIQNEMKDFPAGHIISSSCEERTMLYHVNEGKRKYLGKKDSDVIAQLARKELLAASLGDLNDERKLLSHFVDSVEMFQKSNPRSHIECLSDRSARIMNIIPAKDDVVNEWIQTPYTSSAPFPENKTTRTVDGSYVRSKSEADIYYLLKKYSIPFKYECDLYYDGRIIGCPDFTILHPITYRIFLWEHLGLLDDKTYTKKCIAKSQAYIDAGFYPMVNLLFTGETKDNPFEIDLAEKFIEHFLLA